MTTIRTTCAACGNVELSVDEVRLERIADADVWYCFDCPLCGAPQRHPANERVATILLTVGVVGQTVKGPITEEEIETFVKDLDLLESSNDDV